MHYIHDLYCLLAFAIVFVSVYLLLLAYFKEFVPFYIPNIFMG